MISICRVNGKRFSSTCEFHPVETKVENGTFWIRARSSMLGYLNAPSPFDSEGWFDTGDIGSFDANGFLTLAGRSTDLIITSGYNVYPQVVERAVNECPGVRESAVFGLPDPIRGETVAAAVVRSDPTLDESGLLAFLGTRLVDYQRPRVFVFVDELPRNAMGKVVAAELRKLVTPGK